MHTMFNPKKKQMNDMGVDPLNPQKISMGDTGGIWGDDGLSIHFPGNPSKILKCSLEEMKLWEMNKLSLPLVLMVILEISEISLMEDNQILLNSSLIMEGIEKKK